MGFVDADESLFDGIIPTSLTKVPTSVSQSSHTRIYQTLLKNNWMVLDIRNRTCWTRMEEKTKQSAFRMTHVNYSRIQRYPAGGVQKEVVICAMWIMDTMVGRMYPENRKVSRI